MAVRLAQHGDGVDGEDVVVDDETERLVMGAQHVAHGRTGVLVALADVEGQSGCLGGKPQRGLSLKTGGVVHDVRPDVADRTHAEFGEVPDEQPGGGLLVHAYRVDAPAGAASSDEADGYLLADGDEVLVRKPGGDEDEPHDPDAQETLDGAVKNLGPVGAHRDEEGEVPGARGVAQGVRDLLEEGVAQIGQDQADGPGSLASQGGCCGVDPVSESGGGLGDASPRLLGDLGRSVQRERDQAARDSGDTGHVVLGDVLSARCHGPLLACRGPSAIRPLGRLHGRGRLSGDLMRSVAGTAPPTPPTRRTWSRGPCGACRPTLMRAKMR